MTQVLCDDTHAGKEIAKYATTVGIWGPIRR